jgi:hypothetical protein
LSHLIDSLLIFLAPFLAVVGFHSPLMVISFYPKLWEMACARNIGLTKLPIVCVNVDGYYEPFKMMLNRAYEEELTKLQPQEIVHFAATAEDAIRWIECECATLKSRNKQSTTVTATARDAGRSGNEDAVAQNHHTRLQRNSSVLSSPAVGFHSWSRIIDDSDLAINFSSLQLSAICACVFCTGVTFGVIVSSRRFK